MEDVRKALAVSIAARALSALMGLLALPLYLRFLGVEAYGIVGFFASLQVLVIFMDFGLAATLTRQLAQISASPAALRDGRDIAHTFEMTYLALAAAMAAGLAAGAPLVAARWINLGSFTLREVAWPLQVAAVALACSWPANLYGAGLAGLHKQLPLAISTSLFAVLKVAMTVLFLWLAPSLESFFLAQVIASLLQSAATRMQMWRELALPGHTARARWIMLTRTGRFAGGMTAITLTSILLSQMDKLILSHLLALSDFGIYVIAGTLAASLYVLISPVFSVIYPRMSSLWMAGDTLGLADLYHASSQAMAVLVLPLAAVLVCFPEQAMFVLTDDPAISRRAAWILVFLVAGAAINGVMNIPYAVQLAAGWTSLSVWINLAAIASLGPATWWAANRHGAVGGAAVWGLLNVGYLALTPQLLHARLLPAEKWKWYGQDVLLPAFFSLAAALVIAAQGRPELASRWWVAAYLAACWLAVALVTVATLGRVRAQVARLLRR